MGIQIVKGNLVNVTADAVINSANNDLSVGGGSNKVVFYSAGEELKVACKEIGFCPTGQAVYTEGFNIPADYIIHTVAPYWHGGCDNEAAKLRSCILAALRIATEKKCKEIAFPAIGTGDGHYPIDEAADIIIYTTREYLEKYDPEMEVWYLCYDAETLLKFRLAKTNDNIDISKYLNRKPYLEFMGIPLTPGEAGWTKNTFLNKKKDTHARRLEVIEHAVKRLGDDILPNAIYVPSPITASDINEEFIKQYDDITGPYITQDTILEVIINGNTAQFTCAPAKYKRPLEDKDVDPSLLAKVELDEAENAENDAERIPPKSDGIENSATEVQNTDSRQKVFNTESSETDAEGVS